MIAFQIGHDPQEARSAAISLRDEAVAAAAESQLQHSGYIGLRGVRCRCDHGILTLQGCVARYHLKQVAQSLVGCLMEVVDIDNRLEVVSPADRSAEEERWPEVSSRTYRPR